MIQKKVQKRTHVLLILTPIVDSKLDPQMVPK